MVGAVGALLILICFGCKQHPQDQSASRLKLEAPAESLARELEQAVPKLMSAAGVPGLQICIIRDGRILWNKGFGVKNARTDQPVDERTVFEAASLTKPFFAFLVMKMVEAGDLDLDRPLVDYAPQEYIEDKVIQHGMDLEGFRRDWFRQITSRQVLSHSSGLPHGGPRRPLPVLFEPGSKYRYSSDGYFYLQRIVEHLRGAALDEIMYREVIEPLGMTDSSLVWRESYEDQAAVGHDMFSGTSGHHRKRRQPHAAATLYTTARDYALFVAAVLNATGLEAETVSEMLAPQIEVREGVFWSLGFGLEDNTAGRAFWQWGDYGIFRNYITAFPEHQIGVVYLTNSFNGLSIGPELVKLALGNDKNLGLEYLNYPSYDTESAKLGRLIAAEGIPAAEEAYRAIRREAPDSLSEEDVNNLGYALLQAGKAAEALTVFQWNIEAFPLSANTYDSLAEAYLRRGDVENAIKFYTKTIEAIPHDPRPDKDFLENLARGARESLERLGKR
jgi:CubicO group peptidase (beta-lactamase class C family)